MSWEWCDFSWLIGIVSYLKQIYDVLLALFMMYCWLFWFKMINKNNNKIKEKQHLIEKGGGAFLQPFFTRAPTLSVCCSVLRPSPSPQNSNSRNPSQPCEREWEGWLVTAAAARHRPVAAGLACKVQQGEIRRSRKWWKRHNRRRWPDLQLLPEGRG